ncbi:hypothetical protein [Neolewinella antarctica]|uniref:Uncharacterized protein n=1 Tax=Neolewinella antarctica TaxID=442734 RepID=A0ABX0X966_9BACT|nr:hypothetical protein [Neolewinella antarctica]NJC25528.1 hypothetical protein [Neolewinella antarctica]
MKYLTLFLTIFLISSCYEDRIACLDPDASNYDLRADEACPDDCCEFPEVGIQVTRVYGGEIFSRDSTYQDAADNDFQVVRLRFYLGGLELVVGNRLTITPAKVIEIEEARGGDTLTTEVNANLVLVGTTGGATANFGTIRIGTEAISGLSGTLGLPDNFAPFVAATAPAASPLLTQPGLLKFRNGRNYLQASLEYRLNADTVVTRIDAYGTEAFEFNLAAPSVTARGSNVRLLLEVDYEKIFKDLDLSQEQVPFAPGITNALKLTGVD